MRDLYYFRAWDRVHQRDLEVLASAESVLNLYYLLQDLNRWEQKRWPGEPARFGHFRATVICNGREVDLDRALEVKKPGAEKTPG